jgi:hypothetical protein
VIDWLFSVEVPLFAKEVFCNWNGGFYEKNEVPGKGKVSR